MARIKPQALLQQSKKKKTPSRMSVTTIITFTLIVILIALSLYATYRYWYPRQIIELRTNLNNFEQAAIFEEPKKATHRSYAVLDTSKGSITLEIYKDAFPEIVDKFIDLCPKQEAFMFGTTNAKQDSEGFELLITRSSIPDQNGKLFLFGRIIKGENVVQEIEEVETDDNYQPKVPVEINDITVKQDLWTAV